MLRNTIIDICQVILFKFRIKYKGKEIWIFNSGADFTGNVKHLYLYILENKKDIIACYLPESKNALKAVREIGGRAYTFNSIFGRFFTRNASVYVTEQYKEKYPVDRFKKDIILLNLWHGVGLKAVERKFNTPNLKVAQSICKKIIKYNTIFKRNTLFLTTSPFMEQHFKYYCDLNDSQILRYGYPRNLIEHHKRLKNSVDITKILEKKDNKRIVLYAPTFRKEDNFLYHAIPDVQKLIDVLESTNSILIIKLHNRISNDFLFNSLKQSSSKSGSIILWDNNADIYEVFKYIDLAIVDYSSIYYDLLNFGVSSFIRYIFDYEDNKEYLVYDYFENTSGQICRDFDELLGALKRKINIDTKKNIQIYNKFWSYSKTNNCEGIINETKKFKPLKINMKNFYSFDVFDTILRRKVLDPKAIFLYVMDKIKTSNLGFPSDFNTSYRTIRIESERNAREELRKKGIISEITFDNIFDKMSSVYNLTVEQINWLKSKEIEAELMNVLPNIENISLCEKLVRSGETVVLISDMYLSKDVIIELIKKVSPIIASIPLYVSSEVGYQKSTKQLYLHVFKEYSPWPFEKWIHYGDNKFSDGKQARILGIETNIHEIPKFNDFENNIIDHNPTYDGYMITGMIAYERFKKRLNNKEYFAFAHVSAYLVPYIEWVINDALRRDLKTLYFISRDGFLLKKIADKFIAVRGINLKTKYIYGSRKVWRISSQINHLDEEFFGSFGNMSGIKTYNDLLESIKMSDDQFKENFPELINQYNKNKKISNLNQLRKYLSTSSRLSKHILNVAEKERSLVCAYLLKEVNVNERFAFVEYWARGYTQTCLSKLLNYISEKPLEVPFYYYRSIYSSENKCPRYNYTTNNTSLLFVEVLFANNPYKSLSSYEYKNNEVKPKLIKQDYDKELLDVIVDSVSDFIDHLEKLSFIGDKQLALRNYSIAAFDYYGKYPNDASIYTSLANLKYSEAIHSDLTEYAPKLNIKMLYHLLAGHKMQKYTRSVAMSIERSNPVYKYLGRLFSKGL